MSEERALADRLSSYGDAVAAFSLVNTLGFFAAIAEVETRCALVDSRGVVVAIMFVVQFFYVGAVVGLRRMETSLREGIESSPKLTAFRKKFYWGRIVFVSFTAFALAFFAWLALDGGSCRPGLS